MDIAKLIEVLQKVRPAFVGMVAVSVTLVLFLPSSVVQKLGITEIRNEYRPVLGIIFVVTYAWLVVELIVFIWVVVRAKIRLRKHLSTVFSNLTEAEKHILREFTDNGRTSVSGRPDDPVLFGLEGKKVLYRPSPLTDRINGPAWNIHVRVLAYLKDNPEFLVAVDERS